MDYSNSLHYLNSFLNLERIQVPTPRTWNLGRMRLLMDWAGHPEKSFFPVLIAGTKGKGSTGFFLESILKASGQRTGFYSSPHLQDPRERIRLNGKMISKNLWAKEIGKIRRMLSGRRLPKSLGEFTYFEIMTLLAMLAFKKEGVEIAIFEIGMGGRLDATNVLRPKLVMLTPVHLDHEAILGNTIAKIAGEKAAIIKPRSYVVAAPQVPEAMKVIRAQVRKAKARLYPHANGRQVPAKLGLAGDFQRMNAGVAVQAANLLQSRFGFQITPQGRLKGLANRHWPGRMETIRSGGVEFLLDGAHNPISIEALVRNLKQMSPARKQILVFGTARDKKADRMLSILAQSFDEVILTHAANPRSYEVEALLLKAKGLFKRIYPFAKVSEAIAFAQRHASSKSRVVVTGSFYLIGEARDFFYA